jgi:amino acid transporter
MSVLAWQAGTASGPFLVGTIIEGLISVRNPDYAAPGWVGTLLVFLVVLVTYVFNMYGSKLMPILSNLLMVLHILPWAAILIVLWAIAPHQSAKTVFMDWENFGGLPGMGVSVLVGQISAIYGCLSMCCIDF